MAQKSERVEIVLFLDYDSHSKNLPKFILDGVLRSFPYKMFPDQGVLGAFRFGDEEWASLVERGNPTDISYEQYNQLMEG